MMMMQGSPRVEIRLAEPTDIGQAAAFLVPLGGSGFADRFPGKTPQDFYEWKYLRNPLGNAIVGVATAGNAIVSVVAATPKRIWLSGKMVLAYELGDFLTDENYRKRGLFSKLIELVCREAKTRGAALAYVRPNDVSFPILAGKLSFFEAQRMDGRRFVIPSNTLSRKTGIPASLIHLSGVDGLLRRRCIPRSTGGGVTVDSISRFGDETDDLWARALSGYDFAVVRESSYLNWRFSDCPTPYKMWCARRNGKIAGFLVASASLAAPVGAIIDIFGESNDVEAVRELLATGMNSLLSSGVRLISTWTLQKSAESASHRLLRRAIPFRTKPHLHLAFRILRPLEITLPLPLHKWHFTLGDCDGA